MNLVTLTNGLLRGKPFEGTYPLAREFKTESWSGKPRDGKVIVVDGAKEVGVWVNESDVSYSEGEFNPAADTHVADLAVELSDEEIAENIEERFNVMDRLTDGVVANSLKSIIISGAPGVGKSYELERKLEAAQDRGKITYTKIAGSVSGRGLYETLWEYKGKHDVVVLDDADRIFGDEDALNVLKAALDTGDKRIISWRTGSGFGKDSDVPTSFEFKGSIVFISNLNFDAIANGKSKIAPHIGALLSRALYVDLGVHNNREIMIRIEQVIRKGDVLAGKNVSEKNKKAILNWVRDNHLKMRRLSIREVLHLGDIVATDPKNWERTAEITLLDPRKARI